MGCVRGGYYAVIKRLHEKLSDMDVEVLSDHAVKRLEPSQNGRIRLHCDGTKILDYDRVVATIPSPSIVSLYPNMNGTLRSLLESVRYLRLVCVTLVMRKSLSPFYVTNLTDSGFPFTGVIEASNVIPGDILKGKALVYLPRYMAPEDRFFDCPDEEVFNIFVRGLTRIFPGLSHEDIIAWVVNREPYVQPIQEIDYSKKIPSMKTPIPNFYMVNTSMILNSTLNNNQVILLAQRMAELLLHETG
jgi:protoporphyrinogen oxidase